MAVDKYFVRCTSCDTRFKSQKSVTQEKVARTKCPTCGGQLVVEEEKPDLVLPVAHESVEAKVAVKAARKSYWPLSRGATLALCVIAVAAAATQLVADATIEADATLKAVNSKVSSENEHFYASEAERDRDKHEESGTPSRQSLLAEEKGTRASHPTVIGTQYPDLHYSWAPAQAYAYAFQTKAKVESLFGHTFDGSCQFYAGPSWDQLVAQALPTSHKSEPKDSSQRTEIADELIRDIEGDSETLAQKFSEQPDWDSTGSAFAVTPDGWLVTCAHVVEDAAQIQVEISGKEYAAQVKVIDYKHDLALLKVDAQSLSTLSVAPAETIQLGDEVRAIGFPLADYLKSRINVTRGTISTQPTGEEGDTLQVDAAVNPGNSGGPVINEKGQIVGVASSKIVHEAVSDVSFATPASQVVELAKKYDVGLPEPSQTSLTLRQATEAVGLVRVKLSAKRIRDGVDVRYSTTLSGVAAPSVGIGWYQGKRNRASTCSVDAFGRVQGLPDGLRLPFLWLHPADLVIEQLDTRGRDSWVTDDTYTIDMAAHGPPLGTSHKREVLQPPPGAIHYRTNGFGFPTITQTGGEHNASDPITLSVSAAHKVIERHEEKVVVAKRMEIVATLPEGKPLFEMTGSGGYVFDLTTNNVKETTLKLDCEWQRNKKKTSFPVEFYAKRVSRDVGMVRRSVNSIKKAIREEKAREEKIRADANRVSSTVLSESYR